MEELNHRLGEENTLKHLSEFVLYRMIMIKFLRMVLTNDGRYIIASILFVKVSMIQKFIVL